MAATIHHQVQAGIGRLERAHAPQGSLLEERASSARLGRIRGHSGRERRLSAFGGYCRRQARSNCLRSRLHDRLSRRLGLGDGGRQRRGCDRRLGDTFAGLLLGAAGGALLHLAQRFVGALGRIDLCQTVLELLADLFDFGIPPRRFHQRSALLNGATPTFRTVTQGSERKQRASSWLTDIGRPRKPVLRSATYTRLRRVGLVLSVRRRRQTDEAHYRFQEGSGCPWPRSSLDSLLRTPLS